MKSRRLVSFIVAACLLFSMSVPAYATDGTSAQGEGTTRTYISSVSLARTNLTTSSRGADANSSTVLDVPAVITETENIDGTVTSESVCWVCENEDGVLEAAYTEGELAELMSSGSYTGGINGSRQNYSITMSATYSVVNMNVEEYNYAYARCYAPVSAKFKFTKNSGSTTITDADLMTALHGTELRLVSSPGTYAGTPANFTRSYTTTSPLSGYEYTFNDYSYYVNVGYGGYYVYVPNGVGSYFLKTDFTYGTGEYSCVYGIYNLDSYDYVIS